MPNQSVIRVKFTIYINLSVILKKKLITLEFSEISKKNER